MKNSYRFFNNSACEYFPCHATTHPEAFNCLFCFCPLYLLKDCGGNFQMRGQVKDCSACKLPHHPKGYDYILKKLKETMGKGKGTGEAL